jgi:nucleotide-binding universal stress UspA family protein
VTEIVVGTIGDSASDDAAALGIALARTLHADVVVAHIRPESWQAPGSGQVDAEWDRYLDESSADIIDRMIAAHARAFAEVGVASAIGCHRSSGAGLDALAAARGSDYLVIGSAPGGVRGRISNGSTSERLLHGASVPVAIATTGYAGVAPERIERLVVALETTADRGHLEPLVAMAAQHGFELAFVSIIRRTTRIYTTQLGHDAEIEVLEVLRAEAEAALERAMDEVVALAPGTSAETEVLVGDDVTSALSRFAWRPGDLLACGSSTTGPLRRVLLGDMTFRILRGSPVPVLVMPRTGA